MVNTVNETIMNYLPIDELDQLFTSFAEDRLNNELWSIEKSDKLFKKYTNFSSTVQIQKVSVLCFLTIPYMKMEFIMVQLEL